MEKPCTHCSALFEITDDDLKFYDRISPIIAEKKYAIPAPTLCPDCRQQRRLAWRNERNLYHRKCDLSGKQVVSMYSTDKLFPVYNQEEWWSDKWDAADYAQDFDFSRPFFEQFSELLQKVPRISLINKEHENSEYCNFAVRNKNCYLLFTSGWCEDSLYSNRVLNCTDVCDCSSVTKSELCYECIDSAGCYNCQWLQNCVDCNGCMFGYGLQNCTDCFACSGLVHKKYHIGNVAFSEKEYFKKVEQLLQNPAAIRQNFEKKVYNQIRKYMNAVQVENATGDTLANCQNAHFCFESQNLQDCSYCYNTTHLKDCADINNNDHSEQDYEVVGGESNYHQCFSDISWFNSDVLYSSMCFHSSNLFGCIGLRQKKYCVFNKQYTKEEYEQLVPKIIEHMQQHGEWGEFFPVLISPFGYNETVAQEYTPLSQEEAKKRGWKWHKEEAKSDYMGPKKTVPENLEKSDESLSKDIFTCAVSGKPYKLTPLEIQLYQKMKIAPPKKCPDVRHKERIARRNPRQLWERECEQCQKKLQTTYSPERPEKIYCETCYGVVMYS